MKWQISFYLFNELLKTGKAFIH